MILLFGASHYIMAQEKQQKFTHADSLRGANGPGRTFWDVLHYDITINPDYESKTIFGRNNIKIRIDAAKQLQIDLQEPLILDSALISNIPLPIKREGNVYWVDAEKLRVLDFHFPDTLLLNLYYHGKPTEAQLPPWDGGWIWGKDELKRPWISAACQNIGASVWYPCKDYQGDEPDEGATLRIVCADSLIGVGNGRLLSVTDTLNRKKVFTWNVVNPINNYCIIPYIGKYVHWSETYPGLNGNLSMDYWVLDLYLGKAKKQFEEVPRMMKAFEYWFGPYPFYEDGYKLVQSSYLGMENQSAIAYGNLFKNGYEGSDLSGTGWGMKWDFIIVHESGHEWFGNSITTTDIADMWIHEGFTNYSESLFTEYYFGKDAGVEYETGLRHKIENDKPVTGFYGVNNEGSSDMYYKASNMIQMIRFMMNDDSLFRKMLMEMNSRFRHRVVTGNEIESFIQAYTHIQLAPIFNQYLRTTKIPVLEYRLRNHKMQYRFTNIVDGFTLQLPVQLSGRKIILNTSGVWKEVKIKRDKPFHLEISPGYLVQFKKLTGNG